MPPSANLAPWLSAFGRRWYLPAHFSYVRGGFTELRFSARVELPCFAIAPGMVVWVSRSALIFSDGRQALIGCD